MVRSHTSLVPRFAINVPYPKGALKVDSETKNESEICNVLRQCVAVEQGIERMAFLLG